MKTINLCMFQRLGRRLGVSFRVNIQGELVAADPAPLRSLWSAARYHWSPRTRRIGARRQVQAGADTLDTLRHSGESAPSHHSSVSHRSKP
jgi:hypothetical protein